MTLPSPPCTRCGRPRPLLPDDPYCPCGGVARAPQLAPPGEPTARGPAGTSPWRWRRAFPFLDGVASLALGEGPVPALEPLALPGLPAGIFALRDDLLPTGSWKDRGSAFLVAALAASGRRALIEDSSGNAGLSLAAHARAAGLPLRVFVPAAATALKKELIRSAGAELIEIEGTRERATEAALAARGPGVTYASHAAQPLFTAGAATAAFDMAEALGGLPGAVIAAAGQGGYLAGVHAGFRALAAARGGTPPRLVAVQPAGCAPLARAFRDGADDAAPWAQPRPSLAEGAVVPRPARAIELLEAVHATGGAAVAVDESSIERALRLLWSAGLRVEPTAALPVAFLLGGAAPEILAGARPVVVLLSGAGLRQGRPLVALPGLEGP
ncbi:MAG: pyridoxal-phosphate dependent enzyme [Acidobacteria bacterium]|jgi:threonine synthase|nr:pyridoxal-phosphate dependent enzyme [Acidobacteriota bacterium]